MRLQPTYIWGILGLYPLTNHFLTSWDIQVPGFSVNGTPPGNLAEPLENRHFGPQNGKESYSLPSINFLGANCEISGDVAKNRLGGECGVGACFSFY